MAVFMNVICSDKYIFMNHCELDERLRLNVVFSIRIIFEANRPQWDNMVILYFIS